MKTFLRLSGLALSSVTAAIVMASASFALIASAATAPKNLISSSDAVVDLLCNAVDWLFWFLIILSVIMVLVAAFFYLTSNGDPEKVSKATKTLTYVAVAVVVAILAKGTPLIVGSLFTDTSSWNVCGG